MTLTGGTQFQSGIAAITTQGQLPGDGWTVVLEFDNANLPAGTNREGFFVVSGLLGEFFPGAGVQKSQAQVALREKGSTVPLAHTTTTVEIASVELAGSSPLRGAPFHYVVPYQLGFEGTYNPSGSTNLQVVARVFLNGDLPTITSAFGVTATRMIFFDLVRLVWPSTFAYRYDAPPLTALNVLPAGYKLLFNSPALPWFGAPEWWLVFASCSYSPHAGAAQLGGPHLRFDADPTGTGSSGIPLIHRVLGGLRAKGANRPQEWHHGGMQLLRVDNQTTSIALHGLDTHNSSQVATLVNSARVLAIRLDAFAFWRAVQIDNGSPQAVKFYNDADVATRVEQPLEVIMPGVAGDVQALCYSMKQPSAQPPRSWAQALRLPDNSAAYLQGYWSIGDDGSERVGHICIGHIDKLQVQDPRVYQIGFSHPGEPKFGLTYDAFDQCLVAFHFENDKSVFSRGGRPPPPPTVVLRPNREAPDLSTLPVLPIEPHREMVEELDEGDTHELDTEVGYLVTWPKFAVGRRSYELSWVLDEGDRPTLLAFFAGLGNRVFAWAPSRSSKRAFVLKTAPDQRLEAFGPAVGKQTWRISVRVLELVWLGENT